MISLYRLIDSIVTGLTTWSGYVFIEYQLTLFLLECSERFLEEINKIQLHFIYFMRKYLLSFVVIVCILSQRKIAVTFYFFTCKQLIFFLGQITSYYIFLQVFIYTKYIDQTHIISPNIFVKLQRFTVEFYYIFLFTCTTQLDVALSIDNYEDSTRRLIQIARLRLRFSKTPQYY